MKNYKPLVSIIIPVYNGSNYLKESIESALSQTYDNIEIIVVNDGSKDEGKTESIALSYGDRIRYLNKENGGVSSALNYGIRNMNGEWFSWLSHDDLYFPTKIEDEVNAIIDSKGKFVVYCGGILIDSDGNKINVKLRSIEKTDDSPKETMLKNLKHNRLGGCSFLVSKMAFDEVGLFDENIRTVSDYDMWYRLLFNDYKFIFVNKSLVKTRVHKKQVTYTMSTLGTNEFETFHNWVADRLYNKKEWCDYNSMMYVASCALRRGFKHSADYIFKYCSKLTKNKLKFSLEKRWLFIHNFFVRKARKIARKIFAKKKVK